MKKTNLPDDPKFDNYRYTVMQLTGSQFELPVNKEQIIVCSHSHVLALSIYLGLLL